MKKNIAIKISRVSKKYIIHHDKPTLSERILNGKGEEFYALKNINLTINKGEKLGIIGPNGSGKTTLLKLITGISTPTSGKIKTFGKIVSLIDLEAGFHPDLTGMQNIYLNGTILGLSKKEIDEKIDKIVEFADIGKFIDTPLFTYSSGMVMRVGFSVAIHSNPDIIILDENISVGDKWFKEKTFDSINKFALNGNTLIMASHDLWLIEQLCTRTVVLRQNELVDMGTTKAMIKKYTRHINNY